MIHIQPSGIPMFFYDLANMASNQPGLSRLYIYVKIPNDELQFLKLEDRYEADYEISVEVFDSSGELVEGKSFRHKAVATDYEATNSNRIFNSHLIALDLKPGEYKISLEVMDMDSKKAGRRQLKAKLRDFGKKSMQVSEILFVSRKGLGWARLADLEPESGESLPDVQGPIYAYLEIYGSEEIDSYKVSYEIRNFRRKVIKSGKMRIPRQGPTTQVFIPLPIQDLAIERYVLSIKVSGKSAKASITKDFRIRGVDIPISITNLDAAIEQLRYIASKKDLDRMRKAPSHKKRQYFEEFWKRMDPTPGTEVNELMDEYYRRVAFANHYFSNFRDGWRTDMGMVYIIFGPPNDVERQPYNPYANPFGDKQIWSYEIWYYYDLNKRFVFVDYMGFGDYRLANPLQLFWDY